MRLSKTLGISEKERGEREGEAGLNYRREDPRTDSGGKRVRRPGSNLASARKLVLAQSFGLSEEAHLGTIYWPE